MPQVEYRTERGVAVITFGNPPVNSLSYPVRSGLAQAIDRAAVDSTVRAIVLTGSGGLFSGGADIREFGTPAQLRGPHLRQLIVVVETSEKPVIAAISGTCLGGALELSMAAHYRIAGADAKLGLPEVKLGLLPGAGGTQRLPRIAGEAVARRMILRGEIVDGAEAARLGVVHWAVPAADLPARARALADELAAMPAAAIAACKRCLGAGSSGADGYGREIEGTAALYENAETQRRVREFLERA
jgi:3-hydroxyacyl-CoA dehydrogenase